MIKQSVHMQQNTFSEKPAEKGPASYGLDSCGSRRGHFAPDFMESLKALLKSYRKLEHGVYGKVDTLCAGGGRLFYATTDVERVLGFKRTGRFTSLHFKTLGVRVLPIPNPGNKKRVQYKNFVDETGLRKMLEAKCETVKITDGDRQLFKGWLALCDWLYGQSSDKAGSKRGCDAAKAFVLKMDLEVREEA